MLTLNEGMPRSGKSYDAIKNHILPALRQGREVYARLNFQPDSHDRIAQYLGLDVSEIRKLLHIVDSNQVLPLFVATQDASGEYVLPEKFHNALIVIDECHEFYVSGKTPLPKEQHTFFAMHGHYGADILLMSQSFKDCHSGIRRRVERKTCFQKLSAVGMSGRYLAVHYNSTAPERYEKVESVTHSYESEYFPLYKGFKEGAKTEVYGGGQRTLLQALAAPTLMVGAVLAAATWGFLHFFGKDEAKAAEISTPAPSRKHLVEDMDTLPALAAAGKLVPSTLRPEQTYVIDLAKKGRPRLAARIEHESDTRVLVEWRDQANVQIELLDTASLEALGVTVEPTRYGALLHVGTQAIVVTSWPTNAPVRDHEARLYNTAGPQAAAGNFAPPPTAIAPSMQGSSSSPWIGQAYEPITKAP